MTAVAGEVPGRYDVVIAGQGYTFLRTLDGSSRGRAEYGSTQTFIERQNTSGAYGDNQQAFYLTVSQNDWTGGDGRRFFRQTDPTSTSSFYSASALDISTQGQVTAAQALTSVANMFPWKSSCPTGIGIATSSLAGATASNLHTVDSSGVLTDQGAHGAGTHAGAWGLCSDGKYVYIAGGTKIRKWDGATFTDFSATASAGALATLNNALYSCDGSVLKTYDGSGTASTLFTWKDNTNTARATSQVRLAAYGGKLLIFFPFLYEGPELWIYDGTGVSRLVTLPESSVGFDLQVLYGIVYISALDVVAGGSSRPTIYSYANGTLGVPWRSISTYPTLPSATSIAQPPLGAYAGRLVFVDWTTRKLMQYDPATAATTAIGSTMLAPTSGAILIASAAGGVVVSLGIGSTSTGAAAPGQFFPASTKATVATLQTSLFDFDNSLPKLMRGIKVDWSGSGTIDIAYQLDSFTAASTTLQTTAVSGTEYTLPSNTVAHSISVQITLNGSGGDSPIVKRVYVRAAPQLQSYKVRVYNLDLSSTSDHPTWLEDGSGQTVDGFTQAQNLQTAITSATPITVTDKFGTFTGTCEPAQCSILEIHSKGNTASTPGQYTAQITIREV